MKDGKVLILTREDLVKSAKTIEFPNIYLSEVLHSDKYDIPKYDVIIFVNDDGRTKILKNRHGGEAVDEKSVVLQLFEEDLNDTELERNYKNFEYAYKSFSEKCNKLIETADIYAQSLIEVKDAIILAVSNGVNTDELMKKYQEIKSKLGNIAVELNDVMNGMTYNEKLMEKYKDMSEKKFFIYWKILKELDPDGVKPWMDWYPQYKDRII